MRVLKAGTKAVLQIPAFMQAPATQGRPRGFGGAGCFSSISWLQLCNAENCQPQLGLNNSNKGQGSKCFLWVCRDFCFFGYSSQTPL